MELALFIYLANFVGKLQHTLVLLMVLFIIAAVLHGMWCADQRCENNDVKYSYKYMWIAFLCLFMLIAVPSERTMYLMAGGYAGQKIGTAVVQSEISKDILKILELKAKNELEKLTKELELEKLTKELEKKK